MTSEEAPVAGDAGFTLLELLVALALMATIGATMAAAITQLRPMQAFQQRLDERMTANAIVDVIARDIQAATHIPLIEGGSASSAILKGEREKVVFTAVVPTGYQRQGLREVTYELARSDGSTRLLRTIKLRRFSQEKAQDDEVYFGPVDLRISYLVGTETGGAEWHDEFRQINVLPKAVLIAVSLPGSRQREAARIVKLAVE